MASFHFVPPTDYRGPPVDATGFKISKGQDVYVDAKPIEPLAPPIYPHRALGLQKWPVTMTVSIKVGADGMVSYVGPSMSAVSFPTPFDQDFLEAIKAALSAWHFEPAHIASLEPQPDGSPLVTGLMDVEATLNVAFTFSPGGTVASSRK
ncbi:MAG TPA: hypothetical protein VGG34_01120 [Opitutaceae bacterium]